MKDSCASSFDSVAAFPSKSIDTNVALSAAEDHIQTESIPMISWSSSPSSVLQELSREKSFHTLQEMENEDCSSDDDSIDPEGDDFPNGAVFYLTQALHEVTKGQPATYRTPSSLQVGSFSSMPSLSSIVFDEKDDDAIRRDECDSAFNDSSSVATDFFDSDIFGTTNCFQESSNCVIVVDGCVGRETARYNHNASIVRKELDQTKELRWSADGPAKRSNIRSTSDSQLTKSSATSKSHLPCKKDFSPVVARRWSAS